MIQGVTKVIKQQSVVRAMTPEKYQKKTEGGSPSMSTKKLESVGAPNQDLQDTISDQKAQDEIKELKLMQQAIQEQLKNMQEQFMK